jgi:hypothetical protein
MTVTNFNNNLSSTELARSQEAALQTSLANAKTASTDAETQAKDAALKKVNVVFRKTEAEFLQKQGEMQARNERIGRAEEAAENSAIRAALVRSRALLEEEDQKALEDALAVLTEKFTEGELVPEALKLPTSLIDPMQLLLSGKRPHDFTEDVEISAGDVSEYGSIQKLSADPMVDNIDAATHTAFTDDASVQDAEKQPQLSQHDSEFNESGEMAKATEKKTTGKPLTQAQKDRKIVAQQIRRSNMTAEQKKAARGIRKPRTEEQKARKNAAAKKKRASMTAEQKEEERKKTKPLTDEQRAARNKKRRDMTPEQKEKTNELARNAFYKRKEKKALVSMQTGTHIDNNTPNP